MTVKDLIHRLEKLEPQHHIVIEHDNIFHDILEIESAEALRLKTKKSGYIIYPDSEHIPC